MVERVNGPQNIARAGGIKKTAPKTNKKTNVKIVDKEAAAKRQAAQNFRKLAAAGNAEYVHTNIAEDIASFILDGRAGNYVRVGLGRNNGEKLTFGEAKQKMKLNLPDGSLRHNKTERGGGNFDKYTVPKDAAGNYYLDIFVKDLTKGTGLSEDEIKNTCHNK